MAQTTELTVVCIHCNKVYKIEVDKIGLVQYLNGELIQRALPTLSNSDRELIISQTCQSCWEEMFPPEDTDWLTDDEIDFEDNE